MGEGEGAEVADGDKEAQFEEEDSRCRESKRHVPKDAEVGQDTAACLGRESGAYEHVANGEQKQGDESHHTCTPREAKFWE